MRQKTYNNILVKFVELENVFPAGQLHFPLEPWPSQFVRTRALPIRIQRFALAIGLLSVLLCISSSNAQRVSIPRTHHAWGRFSPGSWAKLRKTTEEFGEDGTVTTVAITETKTTLVKVDTTGCELQVEVTLEVSGKLFRRPVKVIRVGYNGESDGETAVVQKNGDTQLMIGGTRVPCAVLQANIGADDRQIVSTIYYSDKVAPYILKRETQVKDESDGKVLMQTSMNTIAVDMPCKVLAEIKSAAHVETISTGDGGSTYTVEVVCQDVPGGVVSHTSKQINEAGQVVKRSILELVEYGTNDASQTAVQHFKLFHRARARRASLQITP